MSDYGTPPPPPPLVLAILGLLCCWPIGIPAVVFAAQVNGKWASGTTPVLSSPLRRPRSSA